MRLRENEKELWKRAVEFHGHQCPGLAIGFKASLYAIELLDLTYSKDEEVVCITENDACGVDAIQMILGCSVGKGNLLFHIRGKSAYSFYNRKTGASVRLVLKEKPEGLSREEMMEYYLSHKSEDLFEIKPAVLELPERARHFESYRCECCGEMTGSNWIRIEDGRKLCMDCAKKYDRFNV